MAVVRPGRYINEIRKYKKCALTLFIPEKGRDTFSEHWRML